MRVKLIRKIMVSRKYHILAGLCLVVVFLALLVPHALAHGTPAWQQVPIRTKAQKTAGLSGGEGMQGIYAITYAPSNPNIVYLGTDQSGIYKSTDGGATWARKTKGLGVNGSISIAVHPTNPNLVIANGGGMNFTYDQAKLNDDLMGIFRSTNGAETWTRVKQTQYSLPELKKKGGGIIAFSRDGKTIYAGTDNEGLLRSADSGVTWIDVPKAGGGTVSNNIRIYDISMDPNSDAILYASAEDGFYRVTNANSSATQTKIPTPYISYSSSVHPTNSSILYISTNNNGIYKTTNGGTSWTAKNNGLPAGLGVRHLSISSTDPNYMYAMVEKGDIYYSHDGAENWTLVNWTAGNADTKNTDGWVGASVENGDNGGPGRGNYFGGPITPHPSNKNIALLSGSTAQIKKTTDGGIHWTYSNTGYSAGRVGAFSWHETNPNVYALFLYDLGAYLTENGGDTFRFTDLPRYNGNKSTTAGAVHPRDSGTIITASGDYASQNLLRTENYGQSWTFLDKVSSFSFIAFHRQNPNIVYANSYKSVDKGKTWSTLPESVVGMYRGNGDIVYSKSGDESITRISRSTDGGLNWLTPYPNIPAPVDNVMQIAIAPNNPNKIYTAVRDRGVYVYNGSAWSLKTNGLENDQFGYKSVQSVVTDPNNPNVVYVGKWRLFQGLSNGIFRSTDGGETWGNITYNLGPELNVWSLSVNPHDNYVYVGSSNGVWKLPPPGSTNVDATPPSIPTGLVVKP